MSTAAAPGAARNDLSVYSGRTCIGFIRRSTLGCYVYDETGAVVGTVHDLKAARALLVARATKANAAD